MIPQRKRILTRSPVAFREWVEGLSLLVRNSTPLGSWAQRGGMWKWPCASWDAGSRVRRTPCLGALKVHLVDFREVVAQAQCLRFLAGVNSGRTLGRPELWERHRRGPITSEGPIPQLSPQHPTLTVEDPIYSSAFYKRKKNKILKMWAIFPSLYWFVITLLLFYVLFCCCCFWLRDALDPISDQERTPGPPKSLQFGSEASKASWVGEGVLSVLCFTW